MLRYALRRILWAIPTLLGISLVVFFVTTLLPDPPELAPEAAALDPSRAAAIEEERRERFLDLPRFFNADPMDVRKRADVLVGEIAAAGPRRAAAARTLARLGGAALPYVIPELETLSPDSRGRVAVALTPIAIRMGLAQPRDLERPDDAVLFWTRFWEDRALEFTDPAVDRAVTRLVEHGSDLRERDLMQVDTYALPALVVAIETTEDRAALERLTRLAAHAAQRGPVILEGASEDEIRRARADWQEWWYVHESDYVALTGAARVPATIGETRYGKWIMRAITGRFGLAADGEPVAAKLRARAPVTLWITLSAMLASYALAIPLGVVSAWRRGRAIDLATAAVLFALYSLPVFWIAELLRGAFVPSPQADVGALRAILAVVTLSVGSVATLSRYQRTATLDALSQDYVRTARAKGVSTLRELVVHALRNALLPTVTLAGLQLPALLGGALIVEETFRVPGLGFETVRAVETRDTAWLIAIVVVTAVVTTVGLIASDVAYGVLDPRVREALLARKRP